MLVNANYCARSKHFHHMLARLRLSRTAKNIYKGRLTSCKDLLLKDHYFYTPVGHVRLSLFTMLACLLLNSERIQDFKSGIRFQLVFEKYFT